MVSTRRQWLIIGVAFILIACLIASSLFVYFEYFLRKTEPPREEPPVPLDTRISPLENQGVVLEVLRIRHRGLLEKLLKPGNSWKQPPMFYYVTRMDGLVYESRYVSQHGRTIEDYFTTWDTLFEENKIVRDVDEENLTMEITLTLMEHIKSGLFGRRTRDVEQDSLTVTYDFRTGRWSGDDFLRDSDGYGHYLGEMFEVWFNLYQFDYDDDLIPYWTEMNILGTDPMIDDSMQDADGDGVPLYWEWRWGYDPFTWDNHQSLDPDLDGKENVEEYQMSAWFADPFAQDLYVEADWMGRGGCCDPPHELSKESTQGMIERFAEHNIRLYVDDGWLNGPSNGGGQVLPHYKKISQESGMMLQFYNTYFPRDRRGIFLYLVIGHGGGFQHPSKNNLYDTIQIAYYSGLGEPVQQFGWLFAMDLVPTQRGKRVAVGSLILHELAHCCSVNDVSCEFQGIDNMSFGSYYLMDKTYKQTWGQYHSVLNYIYCNTPYTFDLSDGANGPPYDQDDWSMMFVGFSNYMSPKIEQSFNSFVDTPTTFGETTDVLEWRVTGYVYDENLTDQFIKDIGEYSPIAPIPVNWSVYRISDPEAFPEYREVKVFAQPDIITTDQWVLYCEGELDPQGNLLFYSYDDRLKEKIQ